MRRISGRGPGGGGLLPEVGDEVPRGVQGDAPLHIRPNQGRGLKTLQSKRTVPLWPQLEDILRPYLGSRSDDHPLLFPLHYSEEKVKSPMIRKIRSSLDTVQERASMDTRLTTMVFRHTYCATRIQTLEGGAPISLFHVATEMGHKGTDRIADTYGHLQKERKRREEVRYEVPDEDLLSPHWSNRLPIKPSHDRHM